MDGPFSMELSEAKRKFNDHKQRAKSRGIGFELTFSQWMDLWNDHLDERGPRRGQYVMCRKNDIGPYAVGNCYVARGFHNNSVRGYMETRTHAKDLGDFLEQREAMFKSWDPLEQLIAAEEQAS